MMVSIKEVSEETPNNSLIAEENLLAEVAAFSPVGDFNVNEIEMGTKNDILHFRSKV
jgi:hypothetical protein